MDTGPVYSYILGSGFPGIVDGEPILPPLSSGCSGASAIYTAI